jgi:hypothetical protein
MTLLSASLALLWLAVFWLLTRDRVMGRSLVLIGIVASFVAVILATTNLWDAIAAGYPSDSYWTLKPGGRTGVLVISLTGITLMFYLFARKTQIVLRIKREVSGTAWALFDIAFGMLVFGVIHTVSPQIFYTFYRFIFTDLPNQWVIDSAFDATALQSIAALPVDGNLASHLAGITLWAIIPFTLWMHMQHWWRG